MNFEEWYDQDETIVQNDIEIYDLRTAWNAAIDEALKIVDIRDYEGQQLNPQMVEMIEKLKQ